jgi:hypothetical protein
LSFRLVANDTSTVLPSGHLFEATTKLREARSEIAEAERELRGTDDHDEVGLLRQEVSDLDWRTQSLAMRRERDEQRQGQHPGPLTRATSTPDYDAKALEEARVLIELEQDDLADQAASLPSQPTVPDTDSPGLLRRVWDATKAFLSGLTGSNSG